MEDTNLNIAVIGSGRWGINHVRTAHQLLGSDHVIVCDANEAARSKVAAVSSAIGFTTDLESILADANIPGVIVATPAETHYAIAKRCLERGKHVLVEKPITLVAGEARELIEIAARCNRQLMVGHVLLFHPAVVKLKAMVREGVIGRLQYIYSNRLNLGTIRSEENILWSFAPHDISVIQHLTEADPIRVEATGAAFLQKNIEDTTLTILEYPGNVHAHIYVSWLHPFKEQRLVVIGDRGMIVFEDSAKDEKLKFYPKGFERVEGTLQKFEGDYEAVPFDAAQPLAEEHRHFYECVRANKPTLTDGAHALSVLEVLELAQRRLRHE
ncbi:MAG TPA: Gfo/Idh/MocA family oxidoreductase [Bacteroidota bacterium]|nr:Gfo/Idh/MocA family oxidoreductase [Bacteroidota bacterium]